MYGKQYLYYGFALTKEDLAKILDPMPYINNNYSNDDECEVYYGTTYMDDLKKKLKKFKGTIEFYGTDNAQNIFVYGYQLMELDHCGTCSVDFDQASCDENLDKFKTEYNIKQNAKLHSFILGLINNYVAIPK